MTCYWERETLPTCSKEWVQTYSADLVVVVRSAAQAGAKWLLGSVAEEVIREAPCPVLTVGPHVTTTGFRRNSQH